MSHLGILFAVTALLSWAVGDFYIQKSTRALGNWKTIFIIGLAGMVALFPFAQKDIVAISNNLSSLRLLTILSCASLLSALLLFEALKRGKFAVIEPVFGLELPFTVAFSIFLGKEILPSFTYVLIGFIFFGLLLAITVKTDYLLFNKIILEKGVFLALVGSVVMGLNNFLIGVGSRQISPLGTIWFTHSFLAIVTFVYLLFSGQITTLLSDVKNNLGKVLAISFFDTIAWSAFASSMALIPISIATTISESFVALTVLIGVFINKEVLRRHQVLGMIIVISGIIILSLYAS